MKIILAPMEGVVDHEVRDVLTRMGGYDRCVTEFIRVSDQVLPERVFFRMSPELVGIFAKVIQKHFPHMPMEEEGRLNDENLRENFLMRVYLYHDWQKLIAEGITPSGLVKFHSAQKYLFMAHDQHNARQLGQMVAKAGSEDIETLSQAYIDLSMQLLKKQPNRKRHTNTLQHIMGYLRKDIDKTDKQELLDSIMAYQRGEVPLVMPLTLLKHHFTKHPNDYISMQRYLSPFPVELRW